MDGYRGRSWVRSCIDMDPSTRASHPGGEDGSRRSTQRYSDEIERMQREAALSLLVRKQVRV